MRISSLAFALALSVQVLPMDAASRSGAAVHVVKSGQTAAKIAKRAGLSLDQLAKLNPGVDLDRLSVKTRLKLASGSKPVPKAPRRGRKALEPLESLPGIPSVPMATLARMERIRPIGPDQIGNSFSPETASPEALADHLQPVLKGQPASDILAAHPAPLGYELADPANLDLLWPVETRTVSSGYGPRIRRTVKVVKAKNGKKSRRIRVPYNGSHRGIDLNAPNGTDVFAALDGKVVFVGREKAMGNYVVVDHGNGVETVYGHNSRNYAQEGDIVRRGQKIAEVGRTGRATGPHVHFELRLSGLRVNPAPYLNDVEEIPAEILAQNSAAKPPSRR